MPWLKKRRLPEFLLSYEEIVYVVPTLLEQAKVVIVNNNLYNKFSEPEKHIYNITDNFTVDAWFDTLWCYCSPGSSSVCDCEFNAKFYANNRPKSTDKLAKLSRSERSDFLYCFSILKFTTCDKKLVKRFYEPPSKVRRNLFR